MHSKKGIIWTTLIGIVIASLVIIYVVIPILAAGYRIIVPQPDYTTIQGYQRLFDAIQNTPEGKTAYVPLNLKMGFKITTSQSDVSCLPNCLCLCKNYGNAGGGAITSGCFAKIYLEKCPKKPIFLSGEYTTSQLYPASDKPALLTVSEEKDRILVSGDYIGRCINIFDYDQCVSADGCVASFSNDSHYDSVLKKQVYTVTDVCKICSPDPSCSSYSYNEYSIENAVQTGGSIKIPQGSSKYSKAQNQCSKNPCKVAGGCEWIEDESSKTGSCQPKPAAQTSP